MMDMFYVIRLPALHPRVLDGSSIVVTKIPAPPDGDTVDITATIRDVFAIVTSAATLAFMVWQVSK
jgi:hypothetical protein